MLNSKTLADLKQRALAEIEMVKAISELLMVEKKYLGRKGELTKILRTLKNLSLKTRRKIGAGANLIQKLLDEKLATKRGSLETKRSLVSFDTTEPGTFARLGTKHPLTVVRREIEEFFLNFGFQIREGPEVENDYYNFEALNMPPDHPARDIWDTFYIKSKIKNQKSKMLLRTHTSPMQIRVMEKSHPPLAVIVPGRTFRHETTDARHEHTFEQVEGFLVDRQVSVSNLKYLLHKLFEHLFGEKVEIRLRPGYFPFTEPSFELVMSCPFCQKKGCQVCTSGWLEMVGAGMIHPKVFEFVGYRKTWQGFAFGLGVARVAMLKYNIPDIRMFYQNDLRVLSQF